MAKGKKAKSLSQLLRVPEAGIDLSAVDAAATPQAPGGKSATKEDWAKQAPLLADLQERLFATGAAAAAAASCSCFRGSTARARAARSSTSSVRSTPRA